MKRKKRLSLHVNKFKWIVIIVIIIISLGLYSFGQIKKSLTIAIDPMNLADYSFTVSSGQQPAEIIDQLQSEGYINNPQILKVYVKLTDKQFYANDYILNYSKTPIELIDVLANPTPNQGTEQNKLVIIEGDNLDSIATKLATILETDKEEILKVWDDKSFIEELIGNYWFITDDVLQKDVRYPLEGYFTPATYDITTNKSVKEITYQLLNNSEQNFEQYKDIKYPKGYSFNQILTFASIIERETNNDPDKYKVAGVYYNRIDKDMPLQADITVLYALGEHKELVTYKDLEVDSPYNTYKHKGLPPGPIASPSLTAIDAVLKPEKSEYLYYFNTQDTGKTIYSKTYEEHLKVSEENAWDYEK